MIYSLAKHSFVKNVIQPFTIRKKSNGMIGWVNKTFSHTFFHDTVCGC